MKGFGNDVGLKHKHMYFDDRKDGDNVLYSNRQKEEETWARLVDCDIRSSLFCVIFMSIG